MKNIITLFFAVAVAGMLSAQINPRHDKGIFKEFKKGYYQNSILKGIEDFEESKTVSSPRKYFAVDMSGIDIPTSLDQFKKQWHTKPISQGSSGTCWCFATISFLESEIYRINKLEVKLSEMYVVYWEYVERAKQFVKDRGMTTFGEGSEANAVPKIINQYGIVRESDYNGMLPGQTVHNHEAMVNEMDVFLKSVKSSADWNEDVVVVNIKSILNKYMGIPPATITFDGKEMSPLSYLKDMLKIIPSDYFSFMSTNDKPFNQMDELVEDDNWRHAANYYNVPINDFMTIIKNALNEGYTISLCGDVSEPGNDRWSQCAVIPTFDVPSEYINDDARQLRLANKSTTDDHCLHLIGSFEKEGKCWFLVKDSGAGAFDGANSGYKYLSEDYVKLKMMNILVYKMAAKEILDKIIK